VSQQINLYQPIFRKEKIIFSAQTILWLSLGLIALLMLWSLLVSQRISGMEDELARQQEAEQRALQRMTELQASLPPNEPDPALTARVEQLDQRRTALRESLAALQRRMPAAEIDLRARLDELSSHVPNGMWLSRLHLGEQGGTLLLEGAALEAGLVPAFLNSLAQAPELDGTTFRQVHLSSRPEQQPGIRFTLSSNAEEQP